MHLDISRTVCSRGFTALQADATRTLRRVAAPAEHKGRGALPAPSPGEDEGDEAPTSAEKPLPQKIPVERYCERFSGKRLGARVTVDWLEACSLARYTAEVEERGGYLSRRKKPKVVKTKPYLNLDMGGAHGSSP